MEFPGPRRPLAFAPAEQELWQPQMPYTNRNCHKMSKFKVVLKGYVSDSANAEEEFLEKLGATYNNSIEEVRFFIKNSNNVVYKFDDRESADKAKRFLESLGAVAEVVEDVSEDADPSSTLGPTFDFTSPPSEVWRPPGFPPPPEGYYYGPLTGGQGSNPPGTISYIKRFSVGLLIVGAFHILIYNFLLLMGISIVDSLIQFFLSTMRLPQILSIALMIFAEFYMIVVLYNAVEKIIHGHKPDFIDSFKGIGVLLPLKLLVTNLYVTIISLLAMSPLVFIFIFISVAAGPSSHSGRFSIIFFLLALSLILYLVSLFMFVTPVVIVEGVWFHSAVTRSLKLGKNQRLRNAANLFFFSIIIMAVWAVVYFSLRIAISGEIINTVIGLTLPPLFANFLMLLYTDMRARCHELMHQDQ
jgi:hypothetical protein